jgi:hypothetical protein
MIFYKRGNKVLMNISKINPAYQNNRNWAIANKTKGRNATFCAIGSTITGCAKTFTDKDSFINRILDLGQKLSESLRNFEQYSLYKREDDDLDFDKRQRPIAGNVGELACNYETRVNPIAVPGFSLIGGNIGEAYGTISNWFNSMWWRLRPACQKINWTKIKLLDLYFKKLFHHQLKQRQNAQVFLKDHLPPFFGLVGCFCTGIFMPIKAWKKLKDNENKWIDALSDGGFSSQHAYYLVRFTLEELFKAQGSNSKNSWYLVGAGLAANTINIFLPLVDLLPLNERTKTLWKELAQGLTRIFFSSRRLIKGKEWLEKNS